MSCGRNRSSNCSMSYLIDHASVVFLRISLQTIKKTQLNSAGREAEIRTSSQHPRPRGTEKFPRRMKESHWRQAQEQNTQRLVEMLKNQLVEWKQMNEDLKISHRKELALAVESSRAKTLEVEVCSLCRPVEDVEAKRSGIRRVIGSTNTCRRIIYVFVTGRKLKLEGCDLPRKII